MDLRPPAARLRRLLVLLVAAVVVLATVPGHAVAAPVQGVAGTVVVAPGETVDSVQVLAGTVVVRGTVTGDVEVAAGTLLVAGVVEGDVNAGAGTVVIEGQVDGDVSVGTGSLTIAENATVGGTLEAGAGSATVAGTVVGDAAIGAGSIVLEPTATFRGDLRYAGELTDQGATVEGTLERDDSLAGVPVGPDGGVGELLVAVYGLLVSLAVGAVLLLAFPARSRRLATRVVEAPLKAGLYGLVALVGVPVVLVLLAVTLVGIPLAIAGALLFALAIWVASVYGGYAVGEWLLGYTDVDNRWVALALGLLVVALVARVPVLGGLVWFAVLLLGLGGIAAGGLEAYRGRRGAASTPAS